MLLSSEQQGWRSLSLRRYREPASIPDLELPPSENAVIVLIRSGSCRIESFSAGRWRRATYRPGDIGMTPPGQSSRLRWQADEGHETLQLQLPARMIQAALQSRHDGRPVAFPNRLIVEDDGIGAVMTALESGLAEGADDLYAGSAGHWLTSHILFRHGGASPLSGSSREGERALRSVDEYMHAHLGEPVTLDDLAAVAGCGTFQLIRIAKRVWNETPLRRMTRLRLEHARALLEQTAFSIISIALECGYSNPTHFTVAFRRAYGISPTRYRQERRAERRAISR
ncbi:helix-turn-helix domain-containing protein [Aureimonas mangrovi]|uniref:helix-turn-helix domain-containing protein n=1 Tax=Aureimonas mangrovi TaxID=2758041 RepID=UPI001AEEAA10|nr:helix-turn-helix domain-containing protein [Aureimonas mangrovi]